MKAVNLIPADARRGHANVKSLRGPGSAVVGLLVVMLVLVILYVTASNDVSSRQGQLAAAQGQLSQIQAEADRLKSYTQFVALAQERVATVRAIASGRFDWEQALSDLSRVVPANTTLTSLAATSAAGAGAAGASSGSGGLRGDIAAPAFELQGCTTSQDDVARLMSRLRLIRGVTRVTLADSVKPASSASSGPSTPVTAASSTGGSSGCGSNGPTFDLVVFFTPLPTVAVPTGATGATGATGSTGATGASGASPSLTSGSTS